ncbi:flagellum-specific ATP synthase [Novosphingobium sp. PhB57]|jgi:flagellum-specific ATP synthase|uniref:flagellar protein export ATPase FliI n=1 Tax=unclassified Novosphingobium TaxID=2644732 RepID=UPI0010497353|nr:MULTISPECIES: flagellar protein export ATPase FliI [unclassified Novosphingobium]TCU56143.1 flagellum-specific ATP synthase [Novosphingobium sp. PhB57]TDW65282.1 flagellum-specific ATP synthase [Novosphingobium sp. PhB55]
MASLAAAAAGLRLLTPDQRYGRVVAVRGALIEVEGLSGAAQIGSRVTLNSPTGQVEAEVTGLDRGIAHCMPFSEPQGIASGSRADLSASQFALRPSSAWLGRMVDGLGRPVDGKGPLEQGALLRKIKASPPPASARARVGSRLSTGVRALDLFAPLCRGQRLGLFAGSGVGKSVLLSMLARWTECDVAVIGLIGERGREVQEFVQDDLGEEGLARSVVVVATSDEPALMRRQAAWTTLTVAEHFRDQGLNVLCLMDSVTRFAMAQREIGLASGEPPATKGYTPTVFAELPRLLERAGPGLPGQGAITGLFTVLVDGDDHNEPVADAVRGILDGHIVITRQIAERGRYPAIDVLKSVSRTLPHCLGEEENHIRLAARREMATYKDMEEMVRLGAYRAGSSAEVDRAVALAPRIEDLLKQGKQDRGFAQESFDALAALMEVPDEDTL